MPLHRRCLRQRIASAVGWVLLLVLSSSASAALAQLSTPSLPAASLPPLPPGASTMPARSAASTPPGLEPSVSSDPAPAVNGIPGAFTERLRSTLPFSGLFVPASVPSTRSESFTGRLGRPRPGSLFNPGASGPGISQNSDEPFLDGAFDPTTGWPFVLLDHFRPRPERMEAVWLVDTRDCPQEIGREPWPELKVRQFDPDGRAIDQPLDKLNAQAATRPIMIVVQGNLTTQDIALGGLLWSHSWLQHHGGLTQDAVVVGFDWPSERVSAFDVVDVDEKGRRAYVAGYHLARFLQSLPPGSRVGLVGQSYGSLVIMNALQLLGGGCLDPGGHSPRIRLHTAGSPVQIRATIIAGAIDHNWLNPGRRLDRALFACDGLLNLYNKRDEALVGYPLLRRGGHRQALGRVGLTQRDLERLGKIAARYEEHDVNEILGMEHTFLDAVANPRIARWMAPYLYAPDPGPTASNDQPPVTGPLARTSMLLQRLIRP